jgi:competence protein ComFB
MNFHNYMEDIVFDASERLFSEASDICKCEKCKLDVVALALNRLSPKYVVTQRGRVYTKLDTLALQSKADVVKEITKALEIVKKNPRH